MNVKFLWFQMWIHFFLLNFITVNLSDCYLLMFLKMKLGYTQQLQHALLLFYDWFAHSVPIELCLWNRNDSFKQHKKWWAETQNKYTYRSHLSSSERKSSFSNVFIKVSYMEMKHINRIKYIQQRVVNAHLLLTFNGYLSEYPHSGPLKIFTSYQKASL